MCQQTKRQQAQKKSEGPILGGPSWRASCLSAKYLQGPVSAQFWQLIQSMGSPKGLGLLTLLGFCRVPVLFMAFNPSPNSFIRLQNLHLIFGYKFLHLFPLACWVEPLRRQLCQVPIWDGSQFGSVIGWSFPQSMLFICHYTYSSQGTIWGKGFLSSLLSLSFQWELCLATGNGHFRIHISDYWSLS